MTRLRRLAAGCAVLLSCLLGWTVLTGASPAFAGSYVVINGSGSTWSALMVQQWISDVRKTNMVVNFNPDGSSAGRTDFIQGLSDFAVSEIPFQLHPIDGSAPENSPRPYAYLPIVAGGTSFMYHINIGNRQVTDLKLSGATIAKIFTGVITNWDDPAITHDYGHQLPSKTIVPIVRSDGSGTSAQFTLWMATEYPQIWVPFCEKYEQLPANECGLTSQYPSAPFNKAQSGSNGVANYVDASYGDGAINYVEYGYSLNHSPVVSLLNNAGYFRQPTPANVAVALQKAQINSDLTQNLNNVYTTTDPRAYPLSSYSYMIIPTTTAAPMNTSPNQGYTLSSFINYFLCDGQQEAASLGYSPLPENLVLAGFTQVRRIPNYNAPPSISQCNNPTFSGGKNSLIASDAYPLPCERFGAAPCSGAVPAGGTGSGGGSGGGTGGGTGTGASGGTGGTGATGGGTGTNAGTTGTGGSTSSGQTGKTYVDPLTGQTVSASTGTSGTGQDVFANPVNVAAVRQGGSGVLYFLGAIELILAIVLPPTFVMYLRRRKLARQA